MRQGKFLHEVAITLSAEELSARNRDLIRHLNRIDELIEEKKELSKETNQAIKEEQKEVKRLKDIGRTGVEPQMMDCVERLFVSETEKRVEIVRVDTNEVVSTRPPDPDELQLSLHERERQIEEEKKRVIEGFEADAKRHAEEDALTTFGESVLDEAKAGKPLALAAENPAADNDNARPKRKKKGGAKRAREKKAKAEAQPKEKAKGMGNVTTGRGSKKRTATPKPKRTKKPKPVLERHDFTDDEREAI